MKKGIIFLVAILIIASITFEVSSYFNVQTVKYGETIIKANAYGTSVSLGVSSQEGDSEILTRQITNTY